MRFLISSLGLVWALLLTAADATTQRKLEDGLMEEPCVDDPDIAYLHARGVQGIPLPDGALVVTERTDGMIKFVVNQVFDTDEDLTLLAVHHHSSPTEPEAECQKSFEVAPGESKEYTAICIDGVAEVSLFVYVGDGVDFEPTSCAACEPADDSDEFVQYYMELNCNPTKCAMDCPTDIELYFQKGGAEEDRPIEILRMGDNTVTFRVLQPWSGDDDEDPLEHLYIQYHNETDGGTECVNFHDVSPDTMYTFTAYCMVTTPKTLVDIWVSHPVLSTGGSTDVIVPNCCHPPSAVDPNAKIQYSFLLNCVSTCSDDSTTEGPQPTPTTPAPSSLSPPVDICEDANLDFANILGGGNKKGGYVSPDDFSGQGITITATSPTGYTPDGQPRILDTNPSNPNALVDPAFGSPNESCGGPGVGSGGAEMADGENCNELGPVIIIQKGDDDDSHFPEANPLGGTIVIEFDVPETIMNLSLLNLGPDGAMVTVETSTGFSIAVHVDTLGENSLQTLEYVKENVVKITIDLPGVGALAGMTLCRQPHDTPAPVGNTADVETEEPTTAIGSSPTASPAESTPTTASPVGSSPTASPVGFPTTASPAESTPTTASPVGFPPTASPVGSSPMASPAESTPTTASPVGFPPTAAPAESTPTTASPVGSSPTASPAESTPTTASPVGFPPTASPAESTPTTASPVGSLPSSNDERDCFLIGGEESGSGYVDPDAWSIDGIKSITAGVPDGATSGYTPGNKPRFMDTNPGDPMDLTDDSFGSPNMLCDTPGPGLGSAGEPMGPGENCYPLNSVVIVQENDSPEPVSNPDGGYIKIEFTTPVTLNEVYLFNLGPDGANVTIETVDTGTITAIVPTAGPNALQVIDLMIENVVEFKVSLPGIGALASFTICKDPDDTALPTPSPGADSTPAPIGNAADVETDEPTLLPAPSDAPVVMPTDSSGCSVVGGVPAGSGYIPPNAWAAFGISEIKADSPNGYTPDGMPRFLETNPADLGNLIDAGFGSPNESCQEQGPGVGAGGMEMADGENCDPLGSVIIIQNDDTDYSESNPTGGNIYLTFEKPMSLMTLVFFNLGPGGAVITIESTTSDITLHVDSLGVNAVDVYECMRDQVTKVKIHFPGIGALAGLTVCEDPVDTTPSPSPSPSTCNGVMGVESTGPYVGPAAWSKYGITVTASSETGYTPDGKPRLLDTNPADASELTDKGFGSSNESCDVAGPGVGAGGMKMTEGENCNPLGNVIIIQKEDIPNAVSNPDGGYIYLTFDEPKLVESLVLFNLGPQGAIVTFESVDTDMTLHIDSLGVNAVQTFECLMADVTKVTIYLPGIGALAGLTICDDSCPDDVDLYFQKGGPILEGDLPIEVLDQTGRTVTFRLEQEWLDNHVDHLYTQYQHFLGVSTCADSHEVGFGDHIGEYTAYCTLADNITVVNVFLSDPVITTGNVTTPECCPGQPESDNPLAEYTFILYCNPQCESMV